MSRRGFTLIEVIVTTSVLALLVVSALPFLNQYQKGLRTEETALLLQNCLLSVSDYARAGEAGVTSYQAAVSPAAHTCVLSKVSGATPTVIDSYDLSAADLDLGYNGEFALSVQTDVLHTVSFQTTPTGSLPAGSATTVWQLRPAGQPAAAPRQVELNLLIGNVVLK